MPTKKNPAKKTAKPTAAKKNDAAKKASKKRKSNDAVNVSLTSRRSAIAKRAPRVTLITGGTGFLGKHLVRQLVEEGATDLRVLTSAAPHIATSNVALLPPASSSNGAAKKLSGSNVEFIHGSITNADDVRRAMRGVERIYHLAGKVSREPEDKHEMFKLHVEGTRVLCEAANAENVRDMVLVSTSGTIAVTEDGAFIPDEDYPPPVSIITKWAYYASKFYEERTVLENFKGARLVIVNPSLLLGAGDERLSSTKIILDFLARKIPTTPRGGLSFVDARDAAQAIIRAMERGRHGERYLLGAANWTFSEFFSRLERLTKISAPRLALPSKLTRFGANALDSLFRHWNAAPPIDAEGIEMAQYFWYCDSAKAERELDFSPRDPMETLNDTVKYVRQNFLGNSAFVK